MIRSCLLRNINSLSVIMKRTPSTSQNKKTEQIKKQKLKQKPENDANSETETEVPANEINFIKHFVENRKKTADSIMNFSFNKKRVRILTEATEVPENAKGILYWMSRDARVQDNWAFLFAQKLAIKNQLTLYCCYCLVPKFLDATIRHYKFLLKGLQEVEKDCNDLNIDFHLLIGPAVEKIPEFLENYKIGAIICDFSPLRVPIKWVEDVKNKLPTNIPLCQVDAHNIVPVWFTSDKQEYAARTIRNKINTKLDTFLTEFPPMTTNKYKKLTECNQIDWDAAYQSLEVNMEVDEVDWAKPGYTAACNTLQQFCEKRLRKFHVKRNDPVDNALSNLSPWFHFGQISVQRCILTVKKYKGKHSESVAAFCEEAIIRRELSDNFCFYNKNYDNLNGITDWALKTLNEHRKDKRNFIYTKNDFEYSKTHDDLWNSAQIQLVKEGKMHGFLRMYWAKKILEWTKTPESGLEIAIYLNDKYSLDGRDPNGYVGCLWSIGGIHDQGWAERPIFGKIRYMNYQGCKRKFDVAAFVSRHGGKIYNKTEE